MIRIRALHSANHGLVVVVIARPPVRMREKRAGKHKVLDSIPVFLGFSDESELGKVRVAIAVPVTFLVSR